MGQSVMRGVAFPLPNRPGLTWVEGTAVAEKSREVRRWDRMSVVERKVELWRQARGMSHWVPEGVTAAK